MTSREQENPSVSSKRRTHRNFSTVNEEFDPALFLLIARKKLKWVGLIFLLGIILSFLYLRYAPRWYEESTTIQISFQNNANKVIQNSNGLYQNSGEDELAAAVELMHSKLFMERIFSRLPMRVSYYTQGTFKDHEVYMNSPYTITADSDAMRNFRNVKIYLSLSGTNGGTISYKTDDATVSIPFQAENWIDTHKGKIKVHVENFSEIDKFQHQLKKNPYFFVINDSLSLTNEYYSRISVKLYNPEAKTIQISCRDLVDRKACDIVNMMAQEYIKFDLEKRKKSAENVLSFIDTQLNAAYGRIKQSEEELDTMHKEKKSNSDADFAKANISRLFTLDDQAAATAEEEKLVSYVKKQVESKKDIDPSELIGIMGGGDYGMAVTENLRTLHSLIIQKQQASYDVTTNNQLLVHLNQQIDEQGKIIMQSLDAIIERLHAKKLDLEAEADRIKIQYLGPAASGNNIEYLRLQHLFAIDEKYYDDLLDKKTQYALDKAGYVPQSQVLETSLPSQIPVTPRKSTTIVTAGLISLSGSIILLFVIYLFYNEVNSVEEIERLAESSVNILGIVPYYTKEIPASQLLIHHSPKSILAESFRSLRTKLQFIRTGNDNPKVISITSTIPGEGKTFVSINLAGIIAFSGKKVIILDLDMRKPRIHSVLGLDNSKGMSTLLIGKNTLSEVVQKTQTQQLDIITAGPIPPNPSELVISKEMDMILDKLRQEYDMIIIDNPPVGMVTDGITMLQKADYPLYVMRAGYSKREFIHFIDRLYFENSFHSLSIILNGVNTQSKGYHYGNYGYGSHYGGPGNYYEA